MLWIEKVILKHILDTKKDFGWDEEKWDWTTKEGFSKWMETSSPAQIAHDQGILDAKIPLTLFHSNGIGSTASF